jgi:hypothetical protein
MVWGQNPAIRGDSRRILTKQGVVHRLHWKNLKNPKKQLNFGKYSGILEGPEGNFGLSGILLN